MVIYCQRCEGSGWLPDGEYGCYECPDCYEARMSEDFIEAQRKLFIEKANRMGINTQLWIEDCPRMGFEDAKTNDYWSGWLMAIEDN